ncbi:MAG: hypothetical protein AAGF11_04070 [Myxococcota bacterium]
MPTRSHIAALLTLGGLTACAETPSFELRWTIEGRPGASVAACSESGVLQVRARALNGPNELDDSGEPIGLVNERIYPCFPEGLEGDDGRVAGWALPRGCYAIELRGIDRSLTPWDDPEPAVFDDEPVEHPGCSPGDPGDSEPPECRPGERVCDCLRLSVGGGCSEEQGAAASAPEGETASEPLVFTLDPPLECEDGIDNDRDGRVDDGDPSCVFALADGTEGLPVGVTDLQLEVSLLAQNPNIECPNIPGFSRIQVWFDRDEWTDNEQLEELSDTDILIFDDTCQLESPYRFATSLPVGLARFHVVGVNGAGVPITQLQSFEQELTPGNNFVQAAVDFGPETFLEPVVGPIIFNTGFVGELGREGNVRFSCALAVDGETPEQMVGKHDRGTLEITDLRVTLFDSRMEPVTTPIQIDDGTVLEGPTIIPCRSQVFTQTLTWGGYFMEVEALSAAGEVCFSNVGAAQVMAPNEIDNILLPRTGDDADLPESCRECEADADCAPACVTLVVDDEETLLCPPLDGWACIVGTCQSPCAEAEDCQDDLLGDLGYACSEVSGYCERP